MKKARIWRAFLIKERKFSKNKNAWLGREDSNLRMVESKSTALPLGDAPIRPLQLPRFRTTPSARPSRCVLDHLVAPAGRRSGGMIAFGSFWQRRSIEGVEAFQPAGR